MYGDKLDELDIKILNLLQLNSRISLNKIGKIIGLSDSPVASRIEKMEQAGVIKGYTALLERSKTSKPVMVMLMVKLKVANTGTFEEFKRLTIDLPEVEHCYIISGNWNFLLHVAAATPQAYATWLFDKILSQEFIASVESAYLMGECKDFKGIPL